MVTMNPTDTTMNGAGHLPNENNLSNGMTVNSSQISRDPDIIEQGKDEEDEKVSMNFTIPIYKKLKFSVYKPLFPLKLALFTYYGAGATISTFLLVFFKQRGLTITELSIMYILSPLVQFLGPTVSGIIADKLGRSKPILVANLLLLIGISACMLAVPSMSPPNCDPQHVNLKCHPKEFGRLIAKTSCDVNTDVIALASCNVTCPENVTQYCNGQNLICEMLEGNEDFDNVSLSVHVNWAYKWRNKCYYNVTSMSHKNITYSWCNVPHKMYCRISCLMYPDYECPPRDSNRMTFVILNLTLLILFHTVFSNCYRFMDITAMCLVKEHNSDFGRQRFFAIAGVLLFSPFTGYIVDASTPEGSEKNYDAAFYFFMGLVCLMLCFVYKLPVRIRPPGKNMWKKSLYLLKNPDNIAFIIVLFVLGCGWGFTKNFTSWFLEGMNIPGFLLGLINSVSAFYGLPFLLTSNWWVKKIGTTQIFILGLLGYVGSGIGYSFLYDPWLSLIVEFTTIFTYHLLWVAVIIHSHSIAPEGLTATVIATAGGVHYSIGKGSGGFIGGLIMETFGARMAYRVVASACLICAVLYAVYLYLRRTCFRQNHDLRNKDDIGNSTYETEDNPKEIYALEVNKS